MPGIALEIRRKCKVCGKVFIAKTLDSQFCCKRCGDVFRKRQLDAKKREETLSRIILQIPDAREYISVKVKEAVAIFGVERDTIYRLISRKGQTYAQTIQSRTRELLHCWRDLQEVSHQRQFRMGPCSQILYPIKTDRQLCLYT